MNTRGNAKEEDVFGYVRASGKKLVNGAGKEILLRGVGFGSWLLPEGYMWKFPGEGDRPRKIERMVRDLIGPEQAALFWDLYYDTYIGEADIKRIADEGFNSVRIPINARILNESRFRLIDRMIAWCREHRLYVILDLHGAPGGQTGTNIDDSERDHPDLFTDERNKRQTVDLWRTIAARYKDEWIVAGYDLLNEPLPEWFSAYQTQVIPLYKEITRAIREVDRKHMIILEGVHWATDWSIFEEKLDDNLMLQFHKYWNNPDSESLRPYLAKREEWDVPIYMGEGGENNKEWYAGAFQLFEDHGISWNFWTWKKMDTTNSPCSIRAPEGWPALARYLEGGDRPEPEAARRILWEYLSNLPLDRCDYHSDVVRSLFRRAPVRIPAAFYGFQGEGIHYGAAASGCKEWGFRAEDGTKLRFAEGNRSKPNFQHGRGEDWQPDEWLCVQLGEGDWVAYDFRVDEPAVAVYTITIRAKAEAAGGSGSVRVSVSLDGNPDDVRTLVLHDEEWSEQAVCGGVPLNEGSHRLRLRSDGGVFLLQWIRIE